MEAIEASMFGMSSRNELAIQYQISLRTLLFYEARGLIKPIRFGTTRYYTAQDRIRLEVILKGKKLGFTLAEIERIILSATSSMEKPDDFAKALTQEELEGQLKHLKARVTEVQDAIAVLKAHPSKD